MTINIAGTNKTPAPVTLLTVTNNIKSAVTAGAVIKAINASKRTTAVTITGNALANVISGGTKNDTLDGGAGDDTLTGGKGNDKLWCDAGKYTFVYANGDGNDTIYGFDNTDMLQITGSFSSSYSKTKKEVYFKVGSTSNAITLSDFSATSFNVNGSNYKISGSTLKKQ